MKKILQKSLASMVSAALCLTAFVGCLTVSAEKGSATIKVGNGSAKPGKTVVVPVEIKANTSTDPAVEKIGGVAVALFDLAFDTENLKVTGVSVPKDVEYFAEPKYADGNGTIAVDPATKSIKILATSKDTTGKNYPLDFASMTVNVTFLVSENATAGEYPVKILNAQACDAGTKTETIVDTLTKYEYANDEDFIMLTTVDGSVTVTPAEEDYITYTGVTYDVATSKITVNRDALSQKMKDVIDEALAAGHAKPQLIVDVDGTEFTFPVSLTYGVGYLQASGFALTHMNLTVKMYIRLTADNAYVFNTNAYEVVLADLVAGMADTDSKAAALVGLNNEWLNTTESYVITDSIAKDEGLITYTDATYDVKTSKIKINRTALSQDMKEVIAGAVSNGSAKPQLIVDVEGTEFIFPVLLTYGAGYIEASGFALPHFTQNVKMYIRIVSGANGEYVVNTNAVTINLHNIVSAATGSNFANAYNTYYNAQ